ncbi:YceK/YidQ family lipoprotein [Gilvimarinus sp. DA14]|uniref:YceK/YidQ family lipoprotein n=1 Tax=Gilvimarinus sp. DA14 TaxID=2956798 RepID=UPI0020B766F5|nr:YceK/YidQ family lipoprotein [Gilvimarinus sp. DA14]UTF58675.1 YceK/YidQ family lipoprotein [Gilvimarinus sp. DA14]
MNRITAWQITMLILFISITGCGSVTTVGSSDSRVTANLERKNTYCKTIPRMYSGVAFDFCSLHAPSKGANLNWFAGYYLVDGIASAVLDTLLLPYTGYLQVKEGSVILD